MMCSGSALLGDLLGMSRSVECDLSCVLCSGSALLGDLLGMSRSVECDLS